MVDSSYQLVYTQKIHREPENTPLLQRKIIWTKRSFSGSMLNFRGDRRISQPSLVGGFTNPFAQYARQIGSFPPTFGVKIKNVWNHQLGSEKYGDLVKLDHGTPGFFVPNWKGSPIFWLPRSRVGGRESQSLSFPTVGAPPGDLGRNWRTTAFSLGG